MQVVPYSHANFYLYQLKDKNIRLACGHGRRWKVTVKSSRDEYRLGKGWRDYVKEHKIEVDDVCVFKMRNIGRYSVKTFSPA